MRGRPLLSLTSPRLGLVSTRAPLISCGTRSSKLPFIQKAATVVVRLCEERRGGAYVRDKPNIRANAPAPLLPQSSVQKGGTYFWKLTRYKMKGNEVTQLLRCSKREYFKKMKPNSERLQQNDTNAHQEIILDSEKVGVLCNHFTKKIFHSGWPPLSPDDVLWIEVDPSACPERLLCTKEVLLPSHITWCHKSQWSRWRLSLCAQSYSSNNCFSGD